MKHSGLFDISFQSKQKVRIKRRSKIVVIYGINIKARYHGKTLHAVSGKIYLCLKSLEAPARYLLSIFRPRKIYAILTSTKVTIIEIREPTKCFSFWLLDKKYNSDN